MKVVVQNGANHCLSRAEVEAMLPLFPKSWGAAVTQIILSAGSDIAAKYHPKEKILSVSSPPNDKTDQTKTKATSELVEGLASAADFDDNIEQIRERCIGVLK